MERYNISYEIFLAIKQDKVKMLITDLKNNKSENLEKNAITVMIPETVGTKIFGVIIVGFLTFTTIIVPIIFGYEITMGLLGHRSRTTLEVFIITIVVIILTLDLLFTTLIVGRRVRWDWQDDVFSLNKIIYKSTEYSWQEIEALYMNPNEKYITILFKELQGPGNRAGDTFMKKDIKPSPETLKQIAIDAGIQVFEDKTLLFADLTHIKTEKQKHKK